MIHTEMWTEIVNMLTRIFIGLDVDPRSKHVLILQILVNRTVQTIWWMLWPYNESQVARHGLLDSLRPWYNIQCLKVNLSPRIDIINKWQKSKSNTASGNTADQVYVCIIYSELKKMFSAADISLIYRISLGRGVQVLSQIKHYPKDSFYERSIMCWRDML